MKLLQVNYFKRASLKILYAILFAVGCFISYPALVRQAPSAAKITECLRTSIYLAKGLKYQYLSKGAYKRAAANSVLFSKINYSLHHTKVATVQLKLRSQIVLSGIVYSPFYFIKSIPQSEKPDHSLILANLQI